MEIKVSPMKRRIKQNAWDNWSGYEGTRKTEYFGTDERKAREWLKSGKPKFREYTLVLREITPGEFTVVSFSAISAKTEPASCCLHTKEVLVRKEQNLWQTPETAPSEYTRVLAMLAGRYEAISGFITAGRFYPDNGNGAERYTHWLAVPKNPSDSHPSVHLSLPLLPSREKSSCQEQPRAGFCSPASSPDSGGDSEQTASGSNS
jgi:hypothetical protein